MVVDVGGCFGVVSGGVSLLRVNVSWDGVVEGRDDVEGRADSI